MPINVMQTGHLSGRLQGTAALGGGVAVVSTVILYMSTT